MLAVFGERDATSSRQASRIASRREADPQAAGGLWGRAVAQELGHSELRQNPRMQTIT